MSKLKMSLSVRVFIYVWHQVGIWFQKFHLILSAGGPDVKRVHL